MAIRLKQIFLFAFLAMTLACEEAFDSPPASEDQNLIVVEGVLTNENINHLIKLSQTYQEQNGKPEPVSGAVVKVLDGNNVYSLTEFPSGSGNYYTPVFRAVIGKTYTLYIQYKGEEFFAQDSSVPVEPLPPIRLRKSGDNYALDFGESGQNPNYIDHKLLWKHTPSCVSLNGCEGRIIFYDLKTIDVNEIYKPEKESFSFPLNTVIIRKKYAVSAAYRTFLRSMLSETEWRGSVFDVERAEVPTNLSEGAVGFFAVSTVVGDTTVVSE